MGQRTDGSMRDYTEELVDFSLPIQDYFVARTSSVLNNAEGMGYAEIP